MKKNIIFILLSILLNIHVFSQTYYYGKHHFGQLEILNDSTCTISFFKMIAGEPCPNVIDTCYYTKSNDTMFITSRIPNRYEIISSDTSVSLEHTIPAILYPVIKTNKQFINENSSIIAYDTINNQFILNNKDYRYFYDIFFISSSRTLDLMVKIKDIKSDFLIIKFNTIQILFPPLCLDSFPLVIKGNRLIPVDRTKQEEFYFNNWFYFPVMKKSKQKKEYKIILPPFESIEKIFNLNYYPMYHFNGY